VPDVGRLQETVAIWVPATWLKITRAFRPLAKQRSYSAEKSAVETVGVGQAGPSTLAHAPPLTTLAHVAVGETREVGGELKCGSAGTQPARLASLLPQRRGRHGGRGGLTAIRLSCCTPHPQQGGGGDSWWGGRQSVGGELLTRRGLAAYCRVHSTKFEIYARSMQIWR
jgi:hypothetical protein